MEQQQAGTGPGNPNADSAQPLTATPTLKGQTFFLANALTSGGTHYLIGVFASEPDAWQASQRELNQCRKVWIEPHGIG